MKNLICLLAVMFAVNVNAQNAEGIDTVANVKNAGNVIITEADGGVNVRIKGAGDDKDYEYTYKHDVKPDSKVSVSQDWELNLPFTKSKTKKSAKRNKWAIISGGFYLGFNSTVGESEDLGVKMVKSLELAWDRIIAVRYRPFGDGLSFSLGFGVGGKTFTIDESLYRFAGDRNKVDFGLYPEGVSPQNSKLSVFSLRVPFNVRQKLGDDFSVSASAIMNFNTNATVKSCYIVENNVKIEESFNGAPVRKVSLDFMAALNYMCVGVYVKYSPQSIFKSGMGPDFKALTVGFGLSL